MPGVRSSGAYSSVYEYLQIEELAPWVDYYKTTDKVQKNYVGPYSTGWLVDTIQRTISAFKGCFLEPVWPKDRMEDWDNKWRNIVADCRAELQRKAGLMKLGGMEWAANHEAPEGGRWIRPPIRRPSKQSLQITGCGRSNCIR